MRSIRKLFSSVILMLAAIALLTANAFATAPCIGALNEPEVPEILRK